MKKSEPLYTDVPYLVADARVTHMLENAWRDRPDVSIRWKATSAGSSIHESIQDKKILASISVAQREGHRVTMIVACDLEDLMDALVRAVQETFASPYDRLVRQLAS